MRRNLLCVALLAAMLGAPPAAQATIYTFVDENGTVHFTNVPKNSRYNYRLIGAAAGSGRPARAGDPRLYDEHISRAASAHDVDPLLVKAVIKVESNFDNLAVSRKGAKGLMQLMPGTAADLNVFDPFDPRANIFGGTSYLRQMLERFGGDVRLALAAYNAGPARVESAGGIPRIAETRQYVERVLGHYRRLSGTDYPGMRLVRAAQ
jgi:soluble lytic murein transglycosylase-like protein